MKRKLKKDVKRESSHTYVSPSLQCHVLLLESSVVANSVVLNPTTPNTNLEYEWVDGGEIGGDYEW